MNATNHTHPDKDRLIAFGLGKLDLIEAAQIETHLTECPDCCETLLDLEDDTFVGLVRDAAESNVAAGNESVSAPTAPFNTGSSSAIDQITHELLDHSRYQILEPIGKGGMGLVFKAEHKLMHRTVALKVISPKLVRDAAAVERFRREVQAAARLVHPNIVTAYDAEQAGDVHFLVMEFVDGTNLSDVVRQSGPLDIATACGYVKQVADGLEHAYSKGMVHRDIKPHNLMVDSSDRVRILDFGLATLALGADEESSQHSPQAASTTLTTGGTLMGTPDFISPEQAAGTSAADIRSDIYSLGCTLYFLLTGRPPFNVGGALERVRAHADAEPTAIETLRPDVPPELASVIHRMMTKDPAARFQSPAAVVDALTQFTQPTAAKQRPRTKLFIALALAASVLAAAAIFYIQLQKTTVRFEVNDPNLAISFNSNSITVKDSGREITVEPGTEQEFVVKQGSDTLETNTFTLTKGQKVALKIDRVNGSINVKSDGSVSIVKSADSVDDWVKKLTDLKDHMQTAFVIGPDLLALEPEMGLEIVRKAWPNIKAQEVKTGILKAFAFSKSLPKKHPKVLQVLHLGMTDPDREIQDYSASYVQDFAHEDFKHDHAAYDKWYAEFGSKPLDEVLSINESRLSEAAAKMLAEFESAMQSGNARDAWDLAGDLGDTKNAFAIPAMIGAIDADNSYDTIYGVGYFGLGRITDVRYSPYHDGAWWRRWWEKNKSRYPKEIQDRAIPDDPKTASGKKHKPFPEDLDSLQGKLNLFKQQPDQIGQTLWEWAGEVANHKNPAAIPFLIGVIDADNTYDTVYGVGSFGLGDLTGVRYVSSHDGAWWRKWWDENKSKFPQEVQATPIPDLKAQLAAWRKVNRGSASNSDPLADIADVPMQDLNAGGDKNKRYFLIGPTKDTTEPANGHMLLIVMPGGDGGEDFNPFVRRIFKNALDANFIVAQPVAFIWRPNQEIVWPTRKNKVDGQKFATEDFVHAVIADVGAKLKLDKKSIFTLSWSSSGPAAYAIALAKNSPVTGSYIAMSVFQPDELPPLENAKGRAFYIEHSPEDQVCPFRMAEEAKTSLEKVGATVNFNTYEGGHGWHGDIFGRIKTGTTWLEQHASSPAAAK